MFDLCFCLDQLFDIFDYQYSYIHTKQYPKVEQVHTHTLINQIQTQLYHILSMEFQYDNILVNAHDQQFVDLYNHQLNKHVRMSQLKFLLSHDQHQLYLSTSESHKQIQKELIKYKINTSYKDIKIKNNQCKNVNIQVNKLKITQKIPLEQSNLEKEPKYKKYSTLIKSLFVIQKINLPDNNNSLLLLSTVLQPSMDDEKKGKCVLLICCVFCLPILAGVGCLIAYIVIFNVKSCQQLCGQMHKFDDNNGSCCFSLNNSCVNKDYCGNLQTLLRVGIYMIGCSVLICCYCVGIFGPRPKQTTDHYVAVQPKKKKYIHAIIQVEE